MSNSVLNLKTALSAINVMCSKARKLRARGTVQDLSSQPFVPLIRACVSDRYWNGVEDCGMYFMPESHIKLPIY